MKLLSDLEYPHSRNEPTQHVTREFVRINLRSRAVLSRTRPAELQTNSLSSLAWLARWLIQKLASQPHDSGHCVGRYPTKQNDLHTGVDIPTRERRKMCPGGESVHFPNAAIGAYFTCTKPAQRPTEASPMLPLALPAPRRTPHTDSAPNSAAVSPPVGFTFD